ncbi:hypothetical protein JHK82_036706 [Glycine max]|uniref:Uncharacterized protein n=1 Tax=Glycine max TaxID=3847 RepID=A0A0R0H082_SOYBN|nr:hypothetical protein JHK82_036706 [Glycine max]KAH1102283.1 hypothetical protein GYH30_036702 [Glycine max]
MGGLGLRIRLALVKKHFAETYLSVISCFCWASAYFLKRRKESQLFLYLSQIFTPFSSKSLNSFFVFNL